MKEIEVWVIVDADGEYGVGVDEETAGESYSDNGSSNARRVIRVVLNVPLPTVTEVEATLPALPSEGVVASVRG